MILTNNDIDRKAANLMKKAQTLSKKKQYKDSARLYRKIADYYFSYSEVVSDEIKKKKYETQKLKSLGYYHAQFAYFLLKNNKIDKAKSELSIATERLKLASTESNNSKEKQILNDEIKRLTNLKNSIIIKSIKTRDGVTKVLAQANSDQELKNPSEPIETKYTFNDVAGLKDVKKSIKRYIINPIKHPEKAKKYYKQRAFGIGFAGPPGCGKTYICQAAAGEANVPFYYKKGSELKARYYGETQKLIDEFFMTLASNTPCIGFLDEFDQIAGKRSGGRYKISDETVDALLESFSLIKDEQVLFLYATNRPWDIDSAMNRTGRVGRNIFIPPPDFKSREAGFRIQTRNVIQATLKNIDYTELATITAGFSHADIEGICADAGVLAFEKDIESDNLQNDKEIVTHDDILTAYIEFGNSSLESWANDTINEMLDNRVKYDPEKPTFKVDERYKEIFYMAKKINNKLKKQSQYREKIAL